MLVCPISRRCSGHAAIGTFARDDGCDTMLTAIGDLEGDRHLHAN